MLEKGLLTNEQVYALAEKAFYADEFAELLSGEVEYACPLPHSFSISTPTDFERIVVVGVYSLYRKSDGKRQAEMLLRYVNGVLNLLRGTPEQFWIGFSICRYQAIAEARGESPFVLIIDEMLSRIRSHFTKNEDALRQMTVWAGANWKDGLLGDIIDENETLKAKYGVSLL